MQAFNITILRIIHVVPAPLDVRIDFFFYEIGFVFVLISQFAH